MLLASLAAPSIAGAQPDQGDGAREQAFIEVLRREDPASAERFITLRDAQQQALAELRRKEGQANAMPSSLRGSFIPQLKQARQTYVESQLKILDFLDERDRRLIVRLEADIAQLNRALEERRRSREDLKKRLAD
jgi:hypothetical protein